jgi:hypothetical protein
MYVNEGRGRNLVLADRPCDWNGLGRSVNFLGCLRNKPGVRKTHTSYDKNSTGATEAEFQSIHHGFADVQLRLSMIDKIRGET